MATETDLMGLGMPPNLAGKLGFQPSTVTAVGTTQTGAATIFTKNATVNATGSAQAVTFPANVDIGAQHYICNPGTIGSPASAIVYVPSGHTLFYNTTAVLNGAYTLTACSDVIFFQAQLKQWYTK